MRSGENTGQAIRHGCSGMPVSPRRPPQWTGAWGKRLNAITCFPIGQIRAKWLLLPECLALVTLLALIWGSAVLVLGREHAHEYGTARDTTEALSKAYAESTVRIISEIDQMILSARLSHAQLGPDFDIVRWEKSLKHRDQFRVQIAVMDREGNQVKSTRPQSNLRQVNVSDRPHFRYHLDHARDDLYISDPVLGRGSGERTIQFTRKLFDANGGFSGIIVVSLGCAELSAFYDTSTTINGFVALISGGGTIMARGPERSDSIGMRLTSLPSIRRTNGRDHDLFMMVTPWDAAENLISYRGLERYSLAVLVGMNEQQMYERYWRTFRHFMLLDSVASIIVLLLGWFWIGQRRQAVRTARSLSVTLAGVTQGIAMLNAEGQVSVINGQAMRLLGLPEGSSGEAQAGMALERLVETARLLNRELAGDVAGRAGDVRILEAMSKGERVLEVRITCLADGGSVHTLTDVTEQNRSQSHIHYLAHHDVLTGLPNRVYLEERIVASLAEAASSGRQILVMFIDLDGFKGVNDTLGHLIGDRLLRHVADVIRSSIGPSDFVARLGGDEFVVVRTDVEEVEVAVELANLQIARISESVMIDEHELRVSTSIGISVFPRDGLDHHILFKKADIALYRAKGEGRATYRIFQPGMDERLHQRVMLEEDLRQALVNGAFQVHFQPQFESQTLRLAGFEALARWEHPEHGWVSPAVFVDVAEECGMISRLGAFVLERACAEAAAWESDCFIAVNVSAFQLLDAGFVPMVRDVLARTGLPARRLELELTESVMTDNGRQTLSALAELRAMGISLALDDFGTGYSSLSNLLRFRFDKVKIDKTFVQEQHRDAEARAILEAILAMGRHIGLTVTAEGVETEQQLTMLREQGCRLIQGYLLGRAVPAAQVGEFLRVRHTLEVVG